MNSKHKYIILLTISVIGTFLLIHVVSLIPNQKSESVDPLASNLMNTNKYLLNENTKLESNVIFEGKGQIKFAGTQLLANLYNDPKGTSFSIENKVPFETIRYMINQISPVLSEDNLDSLVLFKDKQTWQINSIGNSIGEFLTFNSEYLSPFLKGNQQYLDNKTNLSTFSSTLGKFNETTLKPNLLSPNRRNNKETGFHIQIPISNFIKNNVSKKLGLINDIDISFITDRKSNMIQHIEFRIPFAQLVTYPISESEVSSSGCIYLTYDLERNH